MVIPVCYHVPQMLIFGFYNLIRRIPMEREVAGTTHLLTRHCLHETTVGAPTRCALLRSCSVTGGPGSGQRQGDGVQGQAYASPHHRPVDADELQIAPQQQL
jgi:hypothetical protein